MKTIILSIVFLLLFKLDFAQTDSISYFGLTPPDDLPVVFAPEGFDINEDVCFSSDGRECYFTIVSGSGASTVHKIMVTHYENGQWTTPAQATFSDNTSMHPTFADDDHTIYFIKHDGKIWKVTREEDEWSQPEIVSSPFSTGSEWSCHASDLGNIWICSHRSGGVGNCDIWRIPSIGGQFTEAINQNILNTTLNDCTPVPGPNEEYVFWLSPRSGGFGGIDLYISFANGQNGWTTPINMGPTINSSLDETYPNLSMDYEYIFFKRPENPSEKAKLYWVSAKNIIDSLRIASSNIDNINLPVEQNIQVYPNPAKDKINISFGTLLYKNVIIEIADVKGRLILSNRYNNLPFTTIDLSGNAKGIYFVTVITNGQILTKRKIYLD